MLGTLHSIARQCSEYFAPSVPAVKIGITPCLLGYAAFQVLAWPSHNPSAALVPLGEGLWWPVLISGIARNFDFIDAFHQYRFGIEQPVSEINGYVRVHDILCAHTGAYFATHSASACAFTTIRILVYSPSSVNSSRAYFIARLQFDSTCPAP